ncbi:hypothetical protein MHYP_G00186120 [Metynnis hypsauchen]
MRNEMEKTVMTLHCSFAGLQQSGSCGKQSSMRRYLTLRVFLSFSSCPIFSLPCGNIDLVLCECGLADCVTVHYLPGDLVPEGELAWQVILDLKEIVELVVAPVHTQETIAYLDVKVSEHRQRLHELIPVRSRRMVTLKRHIVIKD